MAVSFALESRPNKAGEFPIRVSVSIHQVRMQTTSGYCISKDKWVDALTDKDRKNREQKQHHYVIPATVNSKSQRGRISMLPSRKSKLTLTNTSKALTQSLLRMI